MKVLENKSENRAREIISIHLSRLEEELSNELLSLILVGSLSNNSYTGNIGSDIDLIHILKDETSDDIRKKVIDIIEKTELLTNHDLPIARCIYRIGEMKRPFRYDFQLCLENKDLIELPIEVLRIKDSGITIWGEDVIDSIDTPTRDDIIHSKELSIIWSKQEEEKNPELYKERIKYVENPPIRIIAQSIIVNAMLDYYLITGKSCSSKKEIGKFMKQDVENYIFQELLDLCITYRYSPEQLTLNQEQWLYGQYNNWREKRRDKEIGHIQHLITMKTDLLNIQPSQFYISQEKLDDVLTWLTDSNYYYYDPIPIKLLNGRIIFTDGHTRAYALYKLGFKKINVIWDSEELDWEAYQKCVDKCNELGIQNISDLDGRVLGPEEYLLLWDRWCDQMQNELAKQRSE